jgi:hypothetical protein
VVVVKFLLDLLRLLDLLDLLDHEVARGFADGENLEKVGETELIGLNAG